MGTTRAQPITDNLPQPVSPFLSGGNQSRLLVTRSYSLLTTWYLISAVASCHSHPTIPRYGDAVAADEARTVRQHIV